MYGSMNGGRFGWGAMGDCPAGQQDLLGIGVCTPTLQNLEASVAGSLTSTVAQGIAQSPTVQAGAATAASNAAAAQVMAFYKNNPVMAWGLTAAVVGLIVYGVMSMTGGKKSAA